MTGVNFYKIVGAVTLGAVGRVLTGAGNELGARAQEELKTYTRDYYNALEAPLPTDLLNPTQAEKAAITQRFNQIAGLPSTTSNPSPEQKELIMDKMRKELERVGFAPHREHDLVVMKAANNVSCIFSGLGYAAYGAAAAMAFRQFKQL